MKSRGGQWKCDGGSDLQTETLTYLHWDVVMHGAGKSDRAGVVGKGPHHMQVSGDGAHEVQSKITEGNQGVAKETETLTHLYESPLVVLPLLKQPQKCQANTNVPSTER